MANWPLLEYILPERCNMQDFKSYKLEKKPAHGLLGRRFLLVAFFLLLLLAAVFIYFNLLSNQPPADDNLPIPEQIENPGQKKVLPLQLPGQSNREPSKPGPLNQSTGVTRQAVAIKAEPIMESNITAAVMPEEEETTAEYHTLVYEIQNGDSLATIFKKHNLSANLLHRIIHSSDTAKKLTDIRPGEILYVDLDEERNFLSLRLEQNKLNSLKITAVEDGYEAIENPGQKRIPSPQLSGQSNREPSNPGPSNQSISFIREAVAIEAEPHDKTENTISHTLTYEIKNGDSLASIFKMHDLSASLLHRIVHSSDTATKLTDIRPGETLYVDLDEEQNFLSLRLEQSKISSLKIIAVEDGFEAVELSREVEVRTNHVSGTIENSFYVAAKKAGLSEKLIMQMAGIFGWDIDFALEIRSGDRFTVIFEEDYLDGDKLNDGPILAAEFVNRGQSYHALLYTDDTGRSDYYSPDGRSMRKAFLRAPVDFRRISSRFSRERYHPVLGKKRPHRGVDYAAKTGTPIKAAGDGKIIHRGRKGGYGNTVIIKHGQTYTTLYGHLSRYNKKAKRGSKVKQGQIIGYVGSTGLATGPHLHYEFRVNGVHRNPLTVKLPAAEPIAKKYQEDFQLKTQPLLSQLELINRTLVANAE
jgi:murein DD-endopeptidase MepM/ murein hydrolase activator NlpD